MGNVTAKVSGEIASFMTPAKTNIKSLKVHFSPKQLGTGDPSSENVREIVGWDGVEVNGSGRNLLQNADGSLSYLYLKKGTTITISQSMDANVGYFRGYDVNKVANTPLVWINQNNNGERLWSEYTLEDDIYYAVCYTGTGMKEAQITIDGSVDFKPYQGNNISYQWKLPDEYQEVEYIESTGTQYIDTGVIGRPNIKVETDFELTDSTNISNCGLIGSREGSGEKRFYIISFYNNKWHLGLQGDITSSAYSVIRNQTQKVIFQNVDGYYSLTVNGTEIYNGNSTFSTTYPMYLFGVNNYGTVSRRSSFKLHTLKIQQDGNYIRNYVPCYRKSDGEMGLYDLISQTFYTNQGTGEFLKGEDVFSDTVYGGYVDLISGELVETNVRDVLDTVNKEALSTQYNTSQTVFFRCDTDYTFETKKGTVTGISDFCCESLKPVGSNWGNGDSQDSKVNTITQRYNSTKAVCMRMYNSVFDINADDTVEVKKQKINTWLANNPIVISYKLAEPITHQLTPTQLQSFVGQNNFWSNADYVEIEYELKETEDIQKVRKKIILNQPHTESVIGDIASFTTNMKAPLKECKVYFNPIQEGSGDPSPDNVRNIIGWDGVNVGLPDEYQEVEYIESTGTQYIITNYTPTITENMKIEIDYMFTNKQTGDSFLFGSKLDSLSNTVTVQCENYANNNWYCASGIWQFRSVLSGYGNTLNTRYRLSMDSNLLTIDGKSASQTETRTQRTTVPIYIFAGNWQGRTQFINLGAKIYSLTFTANGIKEADFIPCYRKSDGEIGMYDIVSKTFYTNSGTGTFLKGNDVNTIIGNVSWSDSVGTVYGGYVDLVKGEVVAEYFGFIADGENIKTNRGYVDDTSYGAGIVYMDRYGFPDSDRLSVNTYCSTLNPTRFSSQNCIYWATNGAFYLVFYPFSKTAEDSKTSSEAIEETNEWLKQHPTQIVYKLRTPIHYSLTPQQLLTFKGENNIWSDTNGQTEVKFWTH